MFSTELRSRRPDLVVGHTCRGALGVLFYLSAEQIRLTLPLMPNLWSCVCTYIPRITSVGHWLDVMIFSCHPLRAVLTMTVTVLSCLRSTHLPSARLWRVLQTTMCLCLSRTTALLCCDPQSLFIYEHCHIERFTNIISLKTFQCPLFATIAFAAWQR